MKQNLFIFDMDQYFEREDIYKLCQKANEELEENKFYTFSRKDAEQQVQC